MIISSLTFLIIFAVIGAILYGQRLIKTEKSDAVFGNPERSKGGIHWVIVGSSFLLFLWLYYSWDIAKAFYPKSANEICQVAKVRESMLSLKYLFPIDERQHKSTAIIHRENENIQNYISEISSNPNLSKIDKDVTDDMSVIQEYGYDTKIILGSEKNMKITYKKDFDIIKALL